MAFSGTVSQTTFNTRRVIENAARRCKLPAQSLTSEHIDIANDQLYLLLSDLSNQGIQLWCIEKTIMPIYDGAAQVTLPQGTVDVLNTNLRWLSEVTGTDDDTATSHTVMFDGDTFVTTVGVLWAAASVPLLFERSDDNITWTTVQTEADPAVVSGEWSWFDIDTCMAAAYFRVSAVTGTLTFDQIYLGNNPTEIPMARMNRDDWVNMPNKSFQNNQPLQFWLDRQVNRPVMNIWPTPNASATVKQIVVWRQRYIMDVGTLTQEIEVPQRWYEAIVAGLAAKLALELVEVDPAMLAILEPKAEKALYIAQMEERDNSPIMIAPNISMYTR